MLSRRSMQPNRSILPLLVFLCLTISPLVGQATIDGTEPPPPDWVSVTGPHIDYQSFLSDGALLASPSVALQERALDHLESAIRNGLTSTGDSNLVFLLASACLIPNQTIHAPSSAPAPSNPGIRARALQLLAQLGGEQARSLLCEAIKYEPDAAVLSEAYHAMRLLHVGLDSASSSTIIGHLSDPLENGPNDGLIQEILKYVKESHLLGLGTVGKELFDAILRVYQDDRYLQKTNDLALQTLKAIIGMD